VATDRPLLNPVVSAFRRNVSPIAIVVVARVLPPEGGNYRSGSGRDSRERSARVVTDRPLVNPVVSAFWRNVSPIAIVVVARLLPPKGGNYRSGSGRDSRERSERVATDRPPVNPVVSASRRNVSPIAIVVVARLLPPEGGNYRSGADGDSR